LIDIYKLSYVQINEVAGLYQLRKGDIRWKSV
jgi:hypothetical protein